MNIFTNINLPQRIFEYAIYDIPVVISRTSGVEDYFDDNAIEFSKPDDPDDLASHIFKLYSTPERREKIVLNAKKISEDLRWDKNKEKYLKMVNGLF